MDSIYSIFLRNAALKFEKGDSNILEKNTAESQRGQIQLQLQQVTQEYESLLLEFNLLVNTKMSTSPVFSQLKMNSPLIVDNTIVKQHPFLQQLEKQQQLSNSKLQLEKSILLPDLLAGYSNSSITGMGPDNVYYNRSRRFQSFHAGIGIPLFFGSQKAKISTLKINQQIADNNLYAGTAMFQLKYQKAMQEYTVSLNALDYYESKALKNADEIINASSIQYQSGNINYLEWVMLTNQAVSIKIDYLNAMRKLNTCIIELNYLTNK
jgi:cobalt-zinc-cadmium resistance protein CzcA